MRCLNVNTFDQTRQISCRLLSADSLQAYFGTGNKNRETALANYHNGSVLR